MSNKIGFLTGFRLAIDKEAYRESFEKFPPKEKRLIKKMSAELEKLILQNPETPRQAGPGKNTKTSN